VEADVLSGVRICTVLQPNDEFCGSEVVVAPSVLRSSGVVPFETGEKSGAGELGWACMICRRGRRYSLVNC
jgi:hypothetical protein